MSVSDASRKTLAGIRIFNGAVGLFAARRMAAQLGSDLRDDATFVYPARMFGVRTLVLGVDLLRLRGDAASQRRILREAVLIHATDTAAAAYAGYKRELPTKVARLTTTISAVNTVLAVVSLVTAPKPPSDK